VKSEDANGEEKEKRGKGEKERSPFPLFSSAPLHAFASLLLKIKTRYFTKAWLASGDAGFWFFVSLAFFGSMVWAKSRDPFERVWFTLKTSQGEKVKAVAVLPKPVRPMPTVVYIYGSGGSLITSGTALRQIAELGVATVTLEYNQTNRVAFDEQFTALLDWLPKQKWTTGQPTAWLGLSLGAQQTLGFLLQHPEKQPFLYIRIGGGWLEELENIQRSTFNLQRPSQGTAGKALGGTSSRSPQLSQTPEKSGTPGTRPSDFEVLLVHGENDEVFPVADAKKLAQFFQTNGVVTDLKIIPGKGHVFESDRALLLRCLAENIKSRLTPLHPAPEFPVTKDYLYVLCILPAFLWAGYWLYLRKQLKSKAPIDNAPPSRFEKILRCTAAVLATAALAQTAWHLIPPRLAVSDTTLAIARKSLIAPKWTEDFDALAFQPFWRGQTLTPNRGGDGSSPHPILLEPTNRGRAVPAPAEHRLKTLLTHVELSNYCVYELINWKLDTNIYRQFVLSPIIDSETDPELNWRRPLWEFFYPRIRKENDTSSAAEIVVRNLRERVTIDPTHDWPTGIESIWRNQITTPQGFERIYVATLRSTGVPARLNSEGKAEFWTGEKWQPAPRPLMETFTRELR